MCTPTKKPPHDGHRLRLYKKLEDGVLLQDHELLEALLYNAYPRINTNPIAHNLLETFGSLRGVLHAEFKQLVEVNGVGKNVAYYLKNISAVASVAFSQERGELYIRNYGEFKEFVADRLRGKTAEVLEFYFVEKNGLVKNIYSHTDFDEHKVVMGREKITELLTKLKPYGVLLAHNHLNGNCYPSSDDVNFTAQLQVICNMNGVIFYDHCIYAADNLIYSFFSTGTIQDLQSVFNPTGLVDITQ